MAFTPEDGTGLALANSYATVAFADAYFAERGIATWTGTNTAKEQALVRATDYIEKRFESRWRGCKLTQAQALAWPRHGVYDDSGYALYDPAAPSLPAKLKAATAEYALRALSADLLPDPGTDQNVIRKLEVVGPLTEETVWASPTQAIKDYPAADRMLSSLIIPAGSYR